MAIRAVLDACVLIPASLRDTLFRASQANLYSMRFTDEILEEVRRNLIKKGMTTEESANRLISIIKDKFGESLVEGYEQFLPFMLINSKDRHVLAAAVACRADYIVTQNLGDFPQTILRCFRVEAVSPDRFLLDLFQSHPEIMPTLIFEQANNLSRPPKTVRDVLNSLSLHAKDLSRRMGEHFSSTQEDTCHQVERITSVVEAKKLDKTKFTGA